MDKETPKKPRRNYSQLPFMGYKLFLFVAQVVILVICISFAQILYDNDILPDKEVKESYIQSSCLIVSKKLSEKGHLIHRFRADFLVSYTKNDQPLKSWVTGNGLDQAYSRHKSAQEDALAQFEVGMTYPCWYNPQVPQIAVLVLRHDWASTLPLIVPTIIGMLVAYYILKGILEFFGLLNSKTREIIAEKKRRDK